VSDNKTDTLIDGLCGDLCAVKPLAHPLLRILPWAFVSIVYASIVALVLGIRPDMANKMVDVAFLFEVGIMAFITVSAAIASAWLSVPDARGKEWLPVIPLTLTGLFLFWSSIRFITEESGLPHLHWSHCFQDGALIGMLPAAAIVFMMRKGATTRPHGMCFLNVLAVAGVAYITLRFTCVMDSVGHGGMIHIAPFILLAFAMGLLSRKIYKW
jgi:hypothetical protein